MKTLAFIHRNDTRFSVGDFSPVLSVFSHYELGNTVSPFLLLDHLGPGRLKPNSILKGVSEHPHRGFETVTIMFQGELEHRDSSGGGGIISAGDVQWMTAASGVIHKEIFSQNFAKQGGAFEMLQLWVNLPAKDKMNPPRYQSLQDANIPKVMLEHDAGYIRVIAGRYKEYMGPAKVHSPLHVYDVFVKQGHTIQLPAKSGDTTMMYMRSGRAKLPQDDHGTSETSHEEWDDHGLAVMSNLQEDVEITALRDSHILYLSATPFHEPINGHGPFVMNTYDEILEAFDDIKTGNFIRYKAIETE
ncbi:pirin family protein [Acinetobacter sp. 194]|uniref:pirin family protein n=1 Tax=Acinetobacter shaoyimingii TaxID=2715164 RepID=UPI00140B15CC|nr:pirin family protein [Acinetobacter shaoyimingii]NHB58047.1 pirin family protein [Acinetobacter shaoyimingii]